jgi:hypothetical protein
MRSFFRDMNDFLNKLSDALIFGFGCVFGGMAGLALARAVFQ